MKAFLKAQVGLLIFAALFTWPLYLRWAWESWR